MGSTRKGTQHIYLMGEPRELCFSFYKGQIFVEYSGIKGSFYSPNKLGRLKQLFKNEQLNCT